MEWTDSIYANSESPPINEKEKRKRIKIISHIYKKST